MKKYIQMIIFLIFFSVFSLFLTIFSCRHTPNEVGNLPTICFEKDVMQVFTSNCTISGCHDGSGEGRSFNFKDYNSIVSMVTPGKPYQSRLYDIVTNINSDNFMPPEPHGPLSLEQRSILYTWILQGAQKTSCPDTNSLPPIDTSSVYYPDSVCFEFEILPIIRSSCAITGCHNRSLGEDAIALTNYSEIRRIVVPGNPNRSKLMEVTDPNRSEDIMPPPNYPRLTITQREIISKWIKQGAVNHKCSNICDTTTFAFSTTVSPIIQNNCRSCHSGSKPSFNINLDTYDNIKSVALSGLLYETITNTNNKPLMPPGSMLPSCQIKQIKKWIDAGAPKN